MKKILFSTALFFVSIGSSSAFSPIAHMILADSVAGRLPKANIIRICMDAYPEIARIGAVGPDLPASLVYLHGMSLLHYHKVGDLAKLLLQESLRPTLKKGFNPDDLTPDQKIFIAFAAGWISHIGGDFGSHEYFIYPLAGFYLSGTVEERIRHSKQEELADSWVYTNYAQYQLKYQVKFHGNKKRFFNNVVHILIPKNSLKMLDKIKYRVDFIVDSMLHAQKSNFMELEKNAKRLHNLGGFVKHLQPNFAFDITPYYSCLSKKMENRNTLVKNAFNFGVEFTKMILIDACNNNYDRINNNWNLDTGPNNGNPTYTIFLKFDKSVFSGTRGKLKIVLQDKRKNKDTFELTEETLGYQIGHTKKGRFLYELKPHGKRFFYHIYPEGAAGRGRSDNSYVKNCPDPSLFNYVESDLSAFVILFSKRGVVCDFRLVIEELELFRNGQSIYVHNKNIKMNRRKDTRVTELFKIESKL